MNMRWWIVLSVVAGLGLLTVPVFAQPYTMPGLGPVGQGQRAAGQPVSIVQAEAIARQVVDRSGYPGLVPGHIMEFDNNFYVAVKDKTNSQGVFEFLIDRDTGVVHPEPQSMMWNTQFGHMAGWGRSRYGGMMGSGYGPGYGGGMMGSGYGPGYGGGMMGPGYGPSYGSRGAGQTGATPSTLAQARTQAQKFLDARLPGTKTDEAIAFPGYYTIDVTRNGKVIGMLSVNAYSGQVWYHGWHGTFIQEKDLN